MAAGLLTQSAGWRWTFFIDVPIGIVTFVLGCVLIRRPTESGLRHGLDVFRSVLVTLALMLGVSAIVKSTDCDRASGAHVRVRRRCCRAAGRVPCVRVADR